MPKDEVKYMGSSKNDIWKAYKEKKAELAELKAGEPVSTTTLAQKEAAKKSITNATEIDVDLVGEVLKKLVEGITGFKTEYDDLTVALATKKVELKDVHDIEVSANDLAALIDTKEKLISDRKEEAEKIIADANEIKEEANKYHSDTISKTNVEAHEIADKKSIERERLEEQYNYDTSRKRQIDDDSVTDELKEKSKSLNEREKDIGERENLADEKDGKIQELTVKVEDLENSIQGKVDVAYEEGEAKAKKSAQVQTNIIKSHTDADAKIAQATIVNLQEKVGSLEEQITEANRKVFNASEQVAAMAQSALKAQGDAATISKVSEIAAGSQKK